MFEGVTQGEAERLKLKVLDKDIFGSDTPLGQTDVSTKELEIGPRVDKWLPVRAKIEGQPAGGELHVMVQLVDPSLT